MVTQPAAVAARAANIAQLDADVAECTACPRLVEWREEVARTKRAAFADQTYWGRPVPGFGPADAALAIVGLAPAAHGANRTGRMFTGDRSGDFLYSALYDVGLASQPTATSADDGLELFGVRITAPVHCAPPANKPTPVERDTCRPWLARELELLAPTLRAVVVLGAFGWQALLPVLADAGWHIPRPRPRFGHAAHHTVSAAQDAVSDAQDAVSDAQDAVSDAQDAVSDIQDSLHLFGCFHPSQQNTFTGRLTPRMLRDVLASAASAATLPVRNVT